MDSEYAKVSDLEEILRIGSHISKVILNRKIRDREVLLIRVDDCVVAYLRYSLFWDNTPFVNMLFVGEDQRGRGIGKMLVLDWEEGIRTDGFKCVMTSSQMDENAQHFWRKIGYREIGSFSLPGQAEELLFVKNLG